MEPIFNSAEEARQCKQLNEELKAKLAVKEEEFRDLRERLSRLEMSYSAKIKEKERRIVDLTHVKDLALVNAESNVDTLMKSQSSLIGILETLADKL